MSIGTWRAGVHDGPPASVHPGRTGTDEHPERDGAGAGGHLGQRHGGGQGRELNAELHREP